VKICLMSLGDIVDDPVTGKPFSARERYRATIESAEIADRHGLHGIYIGEHHGIDYTFSAPPVVLAAIASRTRRLRLGTAVALAANLDPFRLAEDYATLDVISGGRVDLVTGRGNFFVSTYSLFGQSIDDSAPRFAEAMTLLAELWPGAPVDWEGQFRPPLRGVRLQPPPLQQGVPPFWIGGGSSPETAKLAGRLGLKLMLPSAFGRPDKFIAVADVYREAFAQAGHKHKAEVGACWHGWVDESDRRAAERWEPRYRAYHAFGQRVISRVNPEPPSYLMNPFDFDMLTTVGPAIVGSPRTFADRLQTLAQTAGADVNLIKMDMGGVPREEYLEMVERLGSEVLPLTNPAPVAAAATA